MQLSRFCDELEVQKRWQSSSPGRNISAGPERSQEGVYKGVDLLDIKKLQEKNIQERKWIQKMQSHHSARTNKAVLEAACMEDKDGSADTGDEEDTIWGTL